MVTVHSVCRLVSLLPKCQHSTQYVMNVSGVGQINIFYLDCNNPFPVIPITFPAHLLTGFTFS